MAGKTKLKDRKPFGTFPITRRIENAQTSYCRCVFFHYNNQNFNVATVIKGEEASEAAIRETETIIVEDEIQNCTVSKSIDQPSGYFSLSLFPTRNWKSLIAPGDWVAIYLYNKSQTQSNSNRVTNENIVMLGNIDRVSRNLEREEDDKIVLKFNISGRNFGKVFEDTSIWYDPYINQENVADRLLRAAGLEIIGNPSEQVKAILDVFLGQGANFGKGKTEGLNQWLMPQEALKLFTLGSLDEIPAELASTLGYSNSNELIFDNKFNSILAREIESNLPGYKTRNMVGLGNSESIWEYLQRSCNGVINEIFLEEVRNDKGEVFPTIVVRPRPFNTPFLEDQFGTETKLLTKLQATEKDDSGAFKIVNKYKTLQELSRESYLEVSQAEVFFEDIGRDDHARFNLFWLDGPRKFDQYRSIYADVNVEKAIGNPFFSRESIQRYGLKKFQQMMDYHMAQDQKKEVTSDTQLFKAFMGQLFDINFFNHLYEGGTIETSGVLEAELGKVLVLLPDEAKENEGKPDPKIYYIEGYEHKWSFPSTWRTTFTVTHGQFQVSTGNKIFIDSSEEDNGQEDTGFQNLYIAKTKAINKI